MNLRRPCARTWIAETIEDGRFDEAVRLDIHRHAALCDSCGNALREAARLRSLFGGLAEETVPDLNHKRERRRLLERARLARFERQPRADGRRGWIRVVLAGGGVMAAVMTAALVVSHRPAVAPTVSVAPRYEVTDIQSATWSNEEEGRTARVRLSAGAAMFHVHHLQLGQRFLVALPDGEIEVRGTRFLVSVDHATTRYVVVTEGKVALRRPGDPERLLMAGQRWDAPPASVAGVTQLSTTPAPAAVPVTPPSGIGGTAKQRRFTVLRAPVARAARVEQAPQPPAPGATASPNGLLEVAPPPQPAAPTSTASLLFARAVAALRDGRYGDADKGWQDFLSRYPRDPRAEDAAFLRAVGCARSGDRRRAAEFARVYLQQFPNGMRRPEAERLSRNIP